MAALYVKKPVVIEAIIWNGTNAEEVKDFCPSSFIDESQLYIETLEGNMSATIGDYIIKGLAGEFYPCKPDIFHKSYDSYQN